MQIINKLFRFKNVYIFFISYVLFINIFFSTPLNANSFKISDLEISTPFDLNFNKKKVIDKGFQQAFIELISMITTSGDKKKIENTSLTTIKRLIDSFTMNSESFINNEYHVKFDVNFNKKNTLTFLEKLNIFPSIPQRKDLLLIPVIVDLDSEEIFLFDKNIFYEKWNINNKRFYLINYLLPNEDLDDVNLLSQNSESIEDYNFEEIIKKYDLNDFIIIIIYKNLNNLRILSKIHLNNSFKVNNKKFENIDISKEENFDFILNDLKTTYENHWKNINQINTSIKLSLTILVKAKNYKRIKDLEKNLNELDLVSSFEISKFNSQNIFFKIVYNSSPDKLINDLKKKNIIIENKNQVWEVK